MARTPLMTIVRAMAARAAAEIDDENAKVAPSTDAAPPRELTRRTVLRGLGAGAALLAVSSIAKTSDAKKRQPKIAIVGAGIAGLNCALTLQDAGLDSTLYEADDHAGGRIKTERTFWQEGHVTEYCGEFIDTGHTTMLGLVARFNLAVEDLHAAELPGSTETYFFDNAYYPYKQANKDFKHLVSTLNQQNKKAPFPTQYNNYTPTGWQLDHISIRDWINQYVPGGVTSKLGQLLDVAYDIEFGAATTDQSALNLISLLPAPTNDLVLFGYSDETYHVVGGNDQVPAAIAAALPAGSIKLNHRLTKIVTQHDGTIELTFDTPNGSKTVTADHVVLTLPFSILRTLDYAHAGFDNLKKTAITQLGYGTNAKVMCEFDERYWRRQNMPWGISTGTAYSDTGFQSAWDMTRAQPGQTGILCKYTGSAGAALVPQDDDEETTATSMNVVQYAGDFLTQIEPLFPGISQHYHGMAALSAQTYDPNLRGSYSYWKVGQNTLFGGYEAARQGKIHFAGEHTSWDAQGYMEGGASTGAAAAAEIIADLSA